MQPYGWKHRIVPRSAPIREVRASKPGIVLEMMYAMMVMPPVQLNQQIQCVGVLRFRWREPRRRRTKMYFAGIYKMLDLSGWPWVTISLTCVTIVEVTINPGIANPYEILFTSPPADPRAGEATYEPQ
jgi:hypothetical protein